MSKWNKKDEQPQHPQWKPSSNDTKDLSEKLKGFKTTKIKLYTYQPLHMYMLSLGVVGTDEKFGAMMVRRPERFKQITDTYDLLNWQQEKDQESLFQAFPEERVAHQLRIQEIINQTRDLLRGISKKMPQEAS